MFYIKDRFNSLKLIKKLKIIKNFLVFIFNNMFKNSNEEGGIKNAETIIGPSIKVKGNFHGEGNIVVEGILEGSIKTTNDLFVGQDAKIIADIVEAKQATIGGAVEGNLKINGYLEITKTAVINGNIKAEQVSIERGATLNGQIEMGGQENIPKEKIA